MKRILTTLAVLMLGIVLAVPAYAGEGKGDGKRKHKRKRPNAERIFKHFDKNEDGLLTSDEVPERAWKRIAKADEDGDGAVSKKELKKAIRKHRGKRGGRRGGGKGGGGDDE